MKKIRIISAFLFFILLQTQTTNAQQGWIRQIIGLADESSYTFYDIQFLNPNTGFIVGYKSSPMNGVLLKTTNSGNTWAITNFPSRALFSVRFMNESTGIISTDYNFKRTSTGGSTWVDVSNPLGTWMAKIIFKDTASGYAVGNNSIAYSYDGGRSWYNALVVNEIMLNDIIFSDWNTGFAVGGNCFKSSNAGGAWLPFAGNSFLGISSSGGNNLIACGYQGFIKKSTDDGVTWNTVYTGTSSDTGFFSIKYLDANNIISSGSGGKILKSSNGGLNWVQQLSGVGSTLLRVVFVNTFTGWICGRNGVILKTTTGGVVTGFTQSTSQLPNKFSLSQNYPNPFNPSTIINYQLTINSFVTLNVYDVNGKLVKELVNEKQSAGNYSVVFDGSGLPSGTYIYRLQEGDFSETKKMVLLK